LRAPALAAALLVGQLCGAGAHASAADSLRYCDRGTPITARQQDRLLGFAAILRQELESSGQSVALVARSGLNLKRFDLRYSHAGISLRANENAPWSVRQLYYACDERRPKLFDQGLAGFVFGGDDPTLGYVSIVLLPREAAAELERTALDKARALRLLSATYSANAYPYSLRYQNCNQWVVELLAAARGRLADTQDGARPLRERAQDWLKAQAYEPTVIDVGWRPLMWAPAFVRWLHNDDHPPQDQAQAIYRVSMPASIESFMRAQVPGATRLEFCHNARHVVVRRGWTPIGDGCVPGEQDTVVSLD
jgi:hypothetical protein